jgi:hypothetical protein
MPSRKTSQEAGALKFSPYLIWSQRTSAHSCETDSEQDEGTSEYLLIEDYLDLADIALKLWNRKRAIAGNDEATYAAQRIIGRVIYVDEVLCYLSAAVIKTKFE